MRRTSDTPPFRTLLHYLTTWNVIEFKGRSVSARFRDLDLLVELGLGVDRKLNEDRIRDGMESLAPEEVSFWYIVNHFGDRFLDEARAVFGDLEEVSPGVWRSQILRRPVFLIDSRSVAVDRESVAVHMVGEESPEIEKDLARVIALEPSYWVRYGGFLASSHPNIFEETRRMAIANAKPGDIDWHRFLETVGVENVAQAVELGQMIRAAGPTKAAEAVDEMIRTAGPTKVAEALGVEQYLASISAEDRQRLKNLLQ